MIPNISAVIPAFNEEQNLTEILPALRAAGVAEIIVSDGGSTDHSVPLARSLEVTVVEAARGRSRQMNAAATAASGDILWFVHADCRPVPQAAAAIGRSIGQGAVGGCFRHVIDSPRPIFRWIEASGHLRARLFRIFYGDQGIFVRKDVFDRLGGFDDIPLFEDVRFSQVLRRCGPVVVLSEPLLASARRWRRQGIVKTTMINWLLSLGFFCGVAPEILKQWYEEIR